MAIPDVDFFARMCFYTLKETAAEDVPLIGFDKAKALWEKEITAGRLLDVRRVELGYYAYRDPKDKETVWLMPAWTCFGSYSSIAGDAPLTTADGLTTADAYMDSCKMLIVSGQHGKALDRVSRKTNRSVRPKLITWSAVK